jgi:hypothetical protein
VIPKQEAAQIFGGRQPVRMAEGGFVWDDPNQPKKPPPEAQRANLGSPKEAASSSFQGQPSQQQQSSDSGKDSGSGQPSATNQGYWSNLVQQQQAAQAANMGSGGAGSIDSLGTLGDEDLANQAVNGTGANTAAGAADVASGLVAGLQKAVDTYAKSIKPWQVQAQAFGKQAPPNYQGVNLQQNQEA